MNEFQTVFEPVAMRTVRYDVEDHIDHDELIQSRCAGIQHLADMARHLQTATLYLERRNPGDVVTAGSREHIAAIKDARKYIIKSGHESGDIHLGIDGKLRMRLSILWDSNEYFLAIIAIIETSRRRETRNILPRLIDRATHSLPSSELHGKRPEPKTDLVKPYERNYRGRKNR